MIHGPSRTFFSLTPTQLSWYQLWHISQEIIVLMTLFITPLHKHEELAALYVSWHGSQMNGWTAGTVFSFMTSSQRSHWYWPTLSLRSWLSSRLNTAEESVELPDTSVSALEVAKDIFDFDFDRFLFFEVVFEFGVFGIATSGSVLTDTFWFWNRFFWPTFVSTWIV